MDLILLYIYVSNQKICKKKVVKTMNNAPKRYSRTSSSGHLKYSVHMTFLVSESIYIYACVCIVQLYNFSFLEVG